MISLTIRFFQYPNFLVYILVFRRPWASCFHFFTLKRIGTLKKRQLGYRVISHVHQKTRKLGYLKNLLTISVYYFQQFYKNSWKSRHLWTHLKSYKVSKTLWNLTDIRNFHCGVNGHFLDGMLIICLRCRVCERMSCEESKLWGNS